MALLSFPSSPVNGQKYPTSPLPGQNQYEWAAAEQTWRLLGSATTVIPGCYGDAFNVASFCVDAQGRITSAVNTPVAAFIPDLQDVTDQGAVTTNVIDVAGLIAASLTYPTVDGSANDVLVTDGAGNLSFVTPPIVDLQYVTNLGATTSNSIDVAGLTAAGLNYPLADGTATQVMTTDGAGNLGWLTTAEVVAVPGSSAAPGLVNQIAFGGGNFYFHDGAQWWQVAGVAF